MSSTNVTELRVTELRELRASMATISIDIW